MTIDQIARQIPGYDPWRDAEGWEFDGAAAQTGIDFFHEQLQIPDGPKAGQSFRLEAWQQAIVANIYGWHRGEERRYRDVFIYLPRKNGKTALGAGLMVQELTRCRFAGAELFSAASTRDQAARIFKDARHMIQRNKWLAGKFKITDSYKSIERKSDFTVYKALASEAGPVHGTRPVFAVIDELHAHPNSNLVDAITTGAALKGTEPLIIYITTADYERESVCNTKHSYACSVRDGKIKDSRCLPVIYEATTEDDWKDPDLWKRVNPNYGVSVSEDYLERACERAQNERSFENEFKRLHLNIKTQSVEAWLPMDRWDQCPAETLFLDGETCYGGLDMSSTNDITAFVLWFPERKACLCWFWLPGESGEIRQRRDGVPYTDWVNSGLVTETSGNFISTTEIVDQICELAEQYDIRHIGVDPAHATAAFNEFEARMHKDFALKVHQNKPQLTSPCKSLEKFVGSMELNHGGNPVLRWMAANCVIERDPKRDLMMPTKQHSSEKIDGIMALLFAIGTCESEEAENTNTLGLHVVTTSAADDWEDDDEWP